jgi:hypothetical protein
MVNLDTIWRQCTDCAGGMMAAFSLLLIALCGITAALAAFGGAEETN